MSVLTLGTLNTLNTLFTLVALCAIGYSEGRSSSISVSNSISVYKTLGLCKLDANNASSVFAIRSIGSGCLNAERSPSIAIVVGNFPLVSFSVYTKLRSNAVDAVITVNAILTLCLAAGIDVANPPVTVLDIRNVCFLKYAVNGISVFVSTADKHIAINKEVSYVSIEFTIADKVCHSLTAIVTCGYALNSLVVYRNEGTAGDGYGSNSIIFINTNIFDYDCRTGRLETTHGITVILLFAVTGEGTAGDLKRSGLEVDSSLAGEATAVNSKLAICGPVDRTKELTVINSQVSIVISVASVSRYACGSLKLTTVNGNVCAHHGQRIVICTKVTVVNSNSRTVRSVNTARFLRISTNQSTILKSCSCFLNPYATTVLTIGLESTILNGCHCTVSNSNCIAVRGEDLVAVQVKSDVLAGNSYATIDVDDKNNSLAVLCSINCLLKCFVLNITDLSSCTYSLNIRINIEVAAMTGMCCIALSVNSRRCYY